MLAGKARQDIVIKRKIKTNQNKNIQAPQEYIEQCSFFLLKRKKYI